MHTTSHGVMLALFSIRYETAIEALEHARKSGVSPRYTWMI